MVKKIQIVTLFIFVLAAFLSGCLSSSTNHGALCKDKKVEFCEDFESSPPQLQSVPITGTEWYVDGDDRLNNWSNDLPLEGRSQQFLASVGLLLGEYENYTKALLMTPSIDFTDVSSATLSFNLMFLTENNWDGMLVVGTIDRGVSWVILNPTEGYPGTLRIGKDILPGYSGFQPYWSHEEVDLSPLLGTDAKLGFFFLSDASGTSPGVALDDVIVDADSRIFVSQASQNIPFSDVNLILPKDPIVSTDLPSAIASLDTPCEGGQAQILKESHRAYVKAINQNGDRYLVLHPESGDYCWVWFEDVWIDTSEVDLPQLSDIKPEDLYLPFCAAHKTPVTYTTDCLSDPDLGDETDGQLKYQLRNALVANGKILTLLIDPVSDLNGPLPQDDPRIGDRALLDQYTADISLGGNLMVSIDDQKGTCYFDKLEPGRIICEDTSINAAGPLPIEICWQGWDQDQICPLGFTSFIESDKCYLLADREGCAPECPSGYQYDFDGKTCLIDRDSASLERPSDRCPEGYRVNTEANCCVSQNIQEQIICPDGYAYLPEKAACQKLAIGDGCPEGLIYKENTGVCLPEVGTSSQKCAVLEVRFPSTEVTVKESTICRKGPGDSFETVGSLSSFSVFEILGVGGNGEYLVIYHAKYKAPCWADRDDFYWEKLNLSILPRFSKPAEN